MKNKNRKVSHFNARMYFLLRHRVIKKREQQKIK